MNTTINPDKLEKYIDQVSYEITNCLNCQPRDSGEWIWIMGIQTWLPDLLNDLRIPESYHEAVAEALTCPHCGTDLELLCDVGIKTEYERYIDFKWDDWYRKYEHKFEDFFVFIEKFPYLGLHHKLGKQLFKKVPGLPKFNIEGELWFRARKVNGSKILTTDDLFPTDPEKVEIGEGRYNHFGQSVFYFAEDDFGAASEVLEEKGLVWLQKFRIIKADNIIDLSHEISEEPDPELDLLSFGLRYGRVLGRGVKRSAGWKPEYFVPRFIADCARLCGFNGVKFNSSRSYSRNLVLFSWEKENIEPIEVPYIYKFEKNIDPLFDLYEF